VERQAWLTWETDGAIHRAPARLLDISRGGAAVEVDGDVDLPPKQSLQFGLGDSPAVAVFLEATLVNFATDRPRGQRIHLAFAKTCPDDLIKTALFGRRCATRRSLLAALGSLMSAFAARARRTLT